ncbi:MAG: choice-of-anchor Q domain-containing protein [Anaerohalosphaeraceae bacterium]
MWLTRQFEYPYWSTNSTFTSPGVCAAWNDPFNPIPYHDSGKSVITNGDVEITIHTEVVHPVWSVMGYITDTNSLGFMYSDAYFFLQTYVIRNLKNEPLTNLEFYQFLHSHGADEYGPYVNSTYCDAAFPDPLANYVPFNPVHRVGNFRYDITQWNGPKTSSSHVDFVGFSSTVEPDWIDNSMYRGHQGRPRDGTHVHIEDRVLNGKDRIYGEEVGGAMGWALGTLDPNESTSLTLAFLFGPQKETEKLVLGKTDDVEAGGCVGPGDTLTYTLQWQNVGTEDAQDAVLVDYLPKGVDYDPVLSLEPLVLDPNYNPADHTYTWHLGTIPAGSSGSRQLRVTVTERAEPGMPMRNRAVLTSSLGLVSAEWDTRVCCWSGEEVIYVDRRAKGADVGTRWRDAYTDLRRALARAAVGCGCEIWVAQGEYDPGRLPEETFVIPAGVRVYGGFAGNESSRQQRNPKKYKTILTDAADAERNETVVRMMNNSFLDGFTITGADNPEGPSYGIYGSGVDFSLANCIVENNADFGIRAINGNIILEWCYVRNNGSDGIRHSGEGYTLSMSNCWVMKQMRNGVFCQSSTPRIFNSIISESDLSEFGNAGVRMINPTNPPVLHNLTMAYNRNVGLSFVDNRTLSDPNDKDWPEVQNCILWYNNRGGEQVSGFGREHIYYSCIYDPNHPQGNFTPDGNGNISVEPKFAYEDPNNVRILYDSPCKDAGNPYLEYEGQTDMDHQERVYGAAVDMGAYEVHCEDISNPLDWNADGLVNFFEFSSFAHAWLSRDPNDPSITDPNLVDPNDFIGWNPVWDLNGNYAVGLSDLILFTNETPWLWKACWLDIEQIQGMGSGGGDMLLMGGDFMGLKDMQSASEAIEQPEVSIEGRISHLQEAIAFLERIWREDPEMQKDIDAEVWKNFMDTVYQGLLELQADSVRREQE